MKRIVFTLAIVVAVLGTQAQSEKYVTAMQQRLGAIDTTRTAAGFKTISDAFLRIAEAEKTQWLPYYYSALCLVNMGWADPKTKYDENAIKIKELCDKAEAIENNAEIKTIRYMVATQQLLVDPQNRWQTYGAEAEKALTEGMKLDPENPRLYYLSGAGVYNTPEQFGGGKQKAKPILEKALVLFNAEKPKALYPNWGKKMTEDMLKDIK